MKWRRSRIFANHFVEIKKLQLTLCSGFEGWEVVLFQAQLLYLGQRVVHIYPACAGVDLEVFQLMLQHRVRDGSIRALVTVMSCNTEETCPHWSVFAEEVFEETKVLSAGLALFYQAVHKRNTTVRPHSPRHTRSNVSAMRQVISTVIKCLQPSLSFPFPFPWHVGC